MILRTEIGTKLGMRSWDSKSKGDIVQELQERGDFPAGSFDYSLPQSWLDERLRTISVYDPFRYWEQHETYSMLLHSFVWLYTDEGPGSHGMPYPIVVNPFTIFALYAN